MKKKKKIKYSCANCKVEFFRYNVNKNTLPKYCSNACYQEDRWHNSDGYKRILMPTPILGPKEIAENIDALKIKEREEATKEMFKEVAKIFIVGNKPLEASKALQHEWGSELAKGYSFQDRTCKIKAAPLYKQIWFKIYDHRRIIVLLVHLVICFIVWKLR